MFDEFADVWVGKGGREGLAALICCAAWRCFAGPVCGLPTCCAHQRRSKSCARWSPLVLRKLRADVWIAVPLTSIGVCGMGLTMSRSKRDGVCAFLRCAVTGVHACMV